MSKKRILFATAYNGNDTTSLIRAWGPFTLMRDEVEIVLPLNPLCSHIPVNSNDQWWKSWMNWFNNIDVCFLHRPYGPIAAQIMAECKLHGIPLWVDHDDDLINIPPQNPHYEVHHSGEVKFPSVEMSYREADILTCSGKVMHEALTTKHGRPDAIHINTGIDDRVLKFKKPFRTNNRIGWRGSESHKSDLLHFKSSIQRVTEAAKGFEWHFWGVKPDYLELHDDVHVEYQKQLNYHIYLKSLTDYNCSRHWVVLEDNIFNRVKSNLSWLDATLAGSAVLAPNYPEFQVPGCFTYDNSNFEGSLEAFLTMDPNTLKRLHDESWNYIETNLLQSKLNKQRSEILSKL
jgi:hypothetical protein